MIVGFYVGLAIETKVYLDHEPDSRANSRAHLAFYDQLPSAEDFRTVDKSDFHEVFKQVRMIRGSRRSRTFRLFKVPMFPLVHLPQRSDASGILVDRIVNLVYPIFCSEPSISSGLTRISTKLQSLFKSFLLPIFLHPLLQDTGPT